MWTKLKDIVTGKHTDRLVEKAIQEVLTAPVVIETRYSIAANRNGLFAPTAEDDPTVAVVFHEDTAPTSRIN